MYANIIRTLDNDFLLFKLKYFYKNEMSKNKNFEKESLKNFLYFINFTTRLYIFN